VKFGIRKLESWATRWRKKSRFDKIPACDGRTDSWTDGHVDRKDAR